MSELRQDSEPPMVAASRWVHQITSIALEMALPAGAGYWLDQKWGTAPWLVILGSALGLLTAGLSFAQMVKKLTPSNSGLQPYRNREGVAHSENQSISANSKQDGNDSSGSVIGDDNSGPSSQ